MKKQYTKPEAKIITYEEKDVITTSSTLLVSESSGFGGACGWITKSTCCA